MLFQVSIQLSEEEKRRQEEQKKRQNQKNLANAQANQSSSQQLPSLSAAAIVNSVPKITPSTLSNFGTKNAAPSSSQGEPQVKSEISREVNFQVAKVDAKSMDEHTDFNSFKLAVEGISAKDIFNSSSTGLFNSFNENSANFNFPGKIKDSQRYFETKIKEESISKNEPVISKEATDENTTVLKQISTQESSRQAETSALNPKSVPNENASVLLKMREQESARQQETTFQPQSSENMPIPILPTKQVPLDAENVPLSIQVQKGNTTNGILKSQIANYCQESGIEISSRQLETVAANLIGQRYEGDIYVLRKNGKEDSNFSYITPSDKIIIENGAIQKELERKNLVPQKELAQAENSKMPELSANKNVATPASQAGQNKSGEEAADMASSQDNLAAEDNELPITGFVDDVPAWGKKPIEKTAVKGEPYIEPVVEQTAKATGSDFGLPKPNITSSVPEEYAFEGAAKEGQLPLENLIRLNPVQQNVVRNRAKQLFEDVAKQENVVKNPEEKSTPPAKTFDQGTVYLDPTYSEVKNSVSAEEFARIEKIRDLYERSRQLATDMPSAVPPTPSYAQIKSWLGEIKGYENFIKDAPSYELFPKKFDDNSIVGIALKNSTSFADAFIGSFGENLASYTWDMDSKKQLMADAYHTDAIRALAPFKEKLIPIFMKTLYSENESQQIFSAKFLAVHSNISQLSNNDILQVYGLLCEDGAIKEKTPVLSENISKIIPQMMPLYGDMPLTSVFSTLLAYSREAEIRGFNRSTLNPIVLDEIMAKNLEARGMPWITKNSSVLVLAAAPEQPEFKLGTNIFDPGWINQLLYLSGNSQASALVYDITAEQQEGSRYSKTVPKNERSISKFLENISTIVGNLDLFIMGHGIEDPIFKEASISLTINSSISIDRLIDSLLAWAERNKDNPGAHVTINLYSCSSYYMAADMINATFNSSEFKSRYPLVRAPTIVTLSNQNTSGVRVPFVYDGKSSRASSYSSWAIRNYVSDEYLSSKQQGKPQNPITLEDFMRHVEPYIFINSGTSAQYNDPVIIFDGKEIAVGKQTNNSFS